MRRVESLSSVFVFVFFFHFLKDGRYVAREDQSEETRQARYHSNLVRGEELLFAPFFVFFFFGVPAMKTNVDFPFLVGYFTFSQRRDFESVGSDGS